MVDIYLLTFGLLTGYWVLGMFVIGVLYWLAPQKPETKYVFSAVPFWPLVLIFILSLHRTTRDIENEFQEVEP